MSLFLKVITKVANNIYKKLKYTKQHIKSVLALEKKKVD